MNDGGISPEPEFQARGESSAEEQQEEERQNDEEEQEAQEIEEALAEVEATSRVLEAPKRTEQTPPPDQPQPKKMELSELLGLARLSSHRPSPHTLLDLLLPEDKRMEAYVQPVSPALRLLVLRFAARLRSGGLFTSELEIDALAGYLKDKINPIALEKLSDSQDLPGFLKTLREAYITSSSLSLSTTGVAYFRGLVARFHTLVDSHLSLMIQNGLHAESAKILQQELRSLSMKSGDTVPFFAWLLRYWGQTDQNLSKRNGSDLSKAKQIFRSGMTEKGMFLQELMAGILNHDQPKTMKFDPDLLVHYLVYGGDSRNNSLLEEAAGIEILVPVLLLPQHLRLADLVEQFIFTTGDQTFSLNSSPHGKVPAFVIQPEIIDSLQALRSQTRQMTIAASKILLLSRQYHSDDGISTQAGHAKAVKSKAAQVLAIIATQLKIDINCLKWVVWGLDRSSTGERVNPLDTLASAELDNKILVPFDCDSLQLLLSVANLQDGRKLDRGMVLQTSLSLSAAEEIPVKIIATYSPGLVALYLKDGRMISSVAAAVVLALLEAGGQTTAARDLEKVGPFIGNNPQVFDCTSRRPKIFKIYLCRSLEQVLEGKLVRFSDLVSILLDP